MSATLVKIEVHAELLLRAARQREVFGAPTSKMHGCVNHSPSQVTLLRRSATERPWDEDLTWFVVTATLAVGSDMLRRGTVERRLVATLGRPPCSYLPHRRYYHPPYRKSSSLMQAVRRGVDLTRPAYPNGRE